MMWEDDDETGHDAGMLRWLITYADLITLLLAFFIILYAISRTQQVKFSLITAALAQQFNSNSIIGQSPGPSIINGDSGTQTAISSPSEAQALNKLENALQSAINQAGLARQVSVETNMRGVEVSIDAALLFPSGSALLSTQAVNLLMRLGTALEKVPNDIEVSGYTDSTPIHTAQFPSNWQLSAMRAANVVYVLSKVSGIDPGRLSIAGFGQYHPIASNATASGRQQNRRVNILVLRAKVAEVAIGNGP
ncbi:MAG: OmpA family protein [Firmicutes bacterium]|jgi:chemotaxis protein MotB|nr:OmpA family protein [Bacillota bacterium]